MCCPIWQRQAPRSSQAFSTALASLHASNCHAMLFAMPFYRAGMQICTSCRINGGNEPQYWHWIQLAKPDLHRPQALFFGCLLACPSANCNSPPHHRWHRCRASSASTGTQQFCTTKLFAGCPASASTSSGKSTKSFQSDFWIVSGTLVNKICKDSCLRWFQNFS